MQEAKNYCEQRGISEATLGNNAFSNAHAIPRLRRKLEKASEGAAKLRAYMRANPAKAKAGSRSSD